MRRNLLIWGMLLLGALTGCASGGGVAGSSGGLAVRSPEFVDLEEVLSGLGYRGIGLEYEEAATLQVLRQAFQDPGVQGRKIDLVYTGLHMAYDVKQQALTVGSMDPQVIIRFITSKVPKR